MLKLRKLTSLLMLSGMLAAGAAQAVTINGGLVNGANQLLDESRETYVDANNDGLFNVGDVIFGYIRISDFQPGGASASNQVYGVFSQEIAAGSAGRNIIFKPTAVAGLTLSALLGGDANVNANAVAAFYDRPTSYVDIINTNPPGPPTSMGGYLDYIRTNGTLRLVAGLDIGTDFLFSEVSVQAAALGMGIGSSNSPFLSPLSNSGLTIASNFGAFSLSYNNTSYAFNTVTTFNPLLGAFVSANVAINSGSTSGANGADTNPNPKNWLDAGVGFSQCDNGAGGTSDCGFQNKNNFAVNVTVPEPGSLALAGLALLGAAAVARRTRKA